MKRLRQAQPERFQLQVENGHEVHPQNGLSAVKKRPGAVSVALGAFALFLARDPIKRAVTRMVSGDEEEPEDGRIVTRIETGDSKFIASAPIVDASLTEGVK